MANVIKLSKGLDINLKGKAAETYATVKEPGFYALCLLYTSANISTNSKKTRISMKLPAQAAIMICFLFVAPGEIG